MENNIIQKVLVTVRGDNMQTVSVKMKGDNIMQKVLVAVTPPVDVTLV